MTVAMVMWKACDSSPPTHPPTHTHAHTHTHIFSTGKMWSEALVVLLVLRGVGIFSQGRQEPITLVHPRRLKRGRQK